MLAGDAYCGLRTQKVRRRNIRAISIGTMAGRCCVKRGSIAFAKSQLTMIGLLFASGASSSSSSPSSSHGNHATKWHLVTRLLGLPPDRGVEHLYAGGLAHFGGSTVGVVVQKFLKDLGRVWVRGSAYTAEADGQDITSVVMQVRADAKTD